VGCQYDSTIFVIFGISELTVCIGHTGVHERRIKVYFLNNEFVYISCYDLFSMITDAQLSSEDLGLARQRACKRVRGQEREQGEIL
jgi:hypothetical protein